jgi:hypothetical protein
MPNRPTLSFPICPLCNEPVELETTKTNEDEEAIHEECYVNSLTAPKSNRPKPRAAENLPRFFNARSHRSRSKFSCLVGSPTAITHDPLVFVVLSSVWQSHGNH